MVAKTGGETALEYFRTDLKIDNKKEGVDFDPVTEGDRAAERAMRALIEANRPDHGILGEEYGLTNENANARWILDPIDGTRAFMMGLPTWGTLVGLTENGRAIAGAMAQPATRDLFSGDGKTAALTNAGEKRTISTSSVTTLSDAVMASTSPYLFSKADRETFSELEAKVRLSRYGTDCSGYALLAAGFIDIVVESGLQTYDIAALIPIVEGAGGVVTTFDGGSAVIGGDIIAAATPELHDAVRAVMVG
ncbi:MAG: histidinol-phosphatase [Pseudomonadota bacterium]